MEDAKSKPIAGTAVPEGAADPSLRASSHKAGCAPTSAPQGDTDAAHAVPKDGSAHIAAAQDTGVPDAATPYFPRGRRAVVVTVDGPEVDRLPRRARRTYAAMKRRGESPTITLDIRPNVGLAKARSVAKSPRSGRFDEWDAERLFSSAASSNKEAP